MKQPLNNLVFPPMNIDTWGDGFLHICQLVNLDDNDIFDAGNDKWIGYLNFALVKSASII